MLASPWKERHLHRVVKTLELEELYADPHKLDSILASGEPVEVMSCGKAVGQFVPHKPAATTTHPRMDYRARFLKMWGPGAFKSSLSVQEEIAEIRSGRNL